MKDIITLNTILTLVEEVCEERQGEEQRQGEVRGGDLRQGEERGGDLHQGKEQGQDLRQQQTHLLNGHLTPPAEPHVLPHYLLPVSLSRRSQVSC